jgi:hypothetical protein
VGPATHRGPRVPARCRGLQRAHSASLLPRLSGLRLRLLRPRFAQLPSAFDRFRSWEGRGSPGAVPRMLDQRPGTTTSKTAVHATAERLRLGLPGMPLMPATFPPALGASRPPRRLMRLGSRPPFVQADLVRPYLAGSQPSDDPQLRSQSVSNRGFAAQRLRDDLLGAVHRAQAACGERLGPETLRLTIAVR